MDFLLTTATMRKWLEWFVSIANISEAVFELPIVLEN